jgi:mevalonate kinase
LIIVNRKDIRIIDPKKQGTYPWIQGWVKNIKEILRKAIVEGKEQVQIPIVEEHIEKIKKEIKEQVPQLTKEDKKKLNELNNKVQELLKSSKIRYWIKDKKVDRITKELKKVLG